jgi:aldose 1-epimerase
VTELGGDPACWLHTVCPDCGAVVDEDRHDCAVRSSPFRGEQRWSEELQCDVLVLEHDDGRPSHHVVAEVVPAFGSNLWRLSVGGVQLLRGDADLLRRRWWTGTLVLWPLPNRVRGKRYEFGGRSVDLSGVVRPEGNEPLIHGVVDDRAWQHDPPVVTATGASVRTWFEITPASDVFRWYPFPSRLSLEIAVQATGVRVGYRVDNLGDEPLPFAFALHPYFELVDGAASEVVVPADGVMAADEELLPTGTVDAMGSGGFDLRRSTPIVDLDLDHVLTRLHAGASPMLRFPTTAIQVEARASEEFTHVVLFTRRARAEGYVCLENQTGSTDAINLYARAEATGDDDLRRAAHLLVLPPGAAHEGWIEYVVSPLSA